MSLVNTIMIQMATLAPDTQFQSDSYELINHCINQQD